MKPERKNPEFAQKLGLAKSYTVANFNLNNKSPQKLNDRISTNKKRILFGSGLNHVLEVEGGKIPRIINQSITFISSMPVNELLADPNTSNILHLVTIFTIAHRYDSKASIPIDFSSIDVLLVLFKYLKKLPESLIFDDQFLKKNIQVLYDKDQLIGHWLNTLDGNRIELLNVLLGFYEWIIVQSQDFPYSFIEKITESFVHAVSKVSRKYRFIVKYALIMLTSRNISYFISKKKTKSVLNPISMMPNEELDDSNDIDDLKRIIKLLRRANKLLADQCDDLHRDLMEKTLQEELYKIRHGSDSEKKNNTSREESEMYLKDFFDNIKYDVPKKISLQSSESVDDSFSIESSPEDDLNVSSEKPSEGESISIVSSKEGSENESDSFEKITDETVTEISKGVDFNAILELSDTKELHHPTVLRAAPKGRRKATKKHVEVKKRLSEIREEMGEIQPPKRDIFVKYSESEFSEYIETKIDKRFIKIFGKKRLIAREIDMNGDLKINEGDVCILDLFDKLYIWYGKRAGSIRKAKGLDVATRIKYKERNSRAEIVSFDDAKDDTTKFWDLLGGRQDIKSYDPKYDSELERSPDILMEIKIEESIATLSIVCAGRLLKQMITSNKIFVLDCTSEVYLWIGKKCDNESRRLSLPLAVDILKQKDRGANVKIKRLPEGTETVLYKDKFSDWPDTLMVTVNNPQKIYEERTGERQQQIDISSILQENIQPDVELIDDGSGQLKIYLISEFDSKLLESSEYGVFYSAESYVVVYYFKYRNKDAVIFFSWQGIDSKNLQKGSSALISVELNDQKIENAKQVRVVQNKEPKHFLTIFERFHYTVLKGNRGNDLQRMIQVTGRNSYNISHGIEVAYSMHNLNSNDCYVINLKNKIFIWKGSYSNEQILENAKGVADHFDNIPQIVKENEETSEFFSIFSSKEEYFNREYKKKVRLFHCSQATGKFEIVEFYNFCREDLDPKDIFILDINTNIFTWIGSKVSENKKQICFDASYRYTTEINKKEGKELMCLIVPQNQEPPSFTTCFHGWYDAQTSFDRNIIYQNVSEIMQVYNKTYSLEELRQKPSHLDLTSLEKYLSDEDFMVTFGMDKHQFSQLKPWEQIKIKKSLKLY